LTPLECFRYFFEHCHFVTPEKNKQFKLNCDTSEQKP
jgi:hypothetical protein